MTKDKSGQLSHQTNAKTKSIIAVTSIPLRSIGNRGKTSLTCDTELSPAPNKYAPLTPHSHFGGKLLEMSDGSFSQKQDGSHIGIIDYLLIDHAQIDHLQIDYLDPSLPYELLRDI